MVKELLGSIFGGGKVIEEGFKLIDAMHTSDEEEIKARVQGKVDLLAAYHPFKKAQRLLALIFCCNFVICFWLVMGFALFQGDASPVLNESGAVIFTPPTTQEVALGVINAFYMGEIMLAIVMFYFGGGFLEGAIQKRNEGKVAAIRVSGGGVPGPRQ